jgi:hypothetical protein
MCNAFVVYIGAADRTSGKLIKERLYLPFSPYKGTGQLVAAVALPPGPLWRAPVSMQGRTIPSAPRQQ